MIFRERDSYYTREIPVIPFCGEGETHELRRQVRSDPGRDRRRLEPRLHVQRLSALQLAPDHLAEVKLAAIEALEGMNMPEQARTQQIDALEARTAMGEARGGLIGTFVTSLIFGAIISIFKRKK